MNTPIYDFVNTYIEKNLSRFHMPGHKGISFLGCEQRDITEILGADVLSEAEGIIGESEQNATYLFSSAHTYYVTQGSTTAICAMLALVETNRPKPLIWAARNVHKAFIHAATLLDLDVEFLSSESENCVLKCEISPDTLLKKLETSAEKPDAVYVTSPDYLGNLQDISGLATVLKNHNIPLLVDNAHGAYLKFLPESLHPLDLGASVCCDSAHKTLPVLTGGAYLHISKNVPESYLKNARQKLSLFSSTSPSYLILQSLDLCNRYLETFPSTLSACIQKITTLKNSLKQQGFVLSGNEPLKIVIDAAKSGLDGIEMADVLRLHNIEPEFYDKDYVTLMATPQNTDLDFERLNSIFKTLVPKAPRTNTMFAPVESERVCSIRQAVFSESEKIPTECAQDRICASLTVSCPPAVPIVICGERITKEKIKLLKYYEIDEIEVIK